MKRLLFCLLLVILSVRLIGFEKCFAESDPTVYTEGTLYYTISNNSITITGCFGKKEEVTVPAMIAGYPVNAIAKGAFTSNKYIKKLNLPDTISKVEPGAIPSDIKVIYNANTDHPQDTPTDLILNGGVLTPTEPAKPTNEPTGTVTPEPTKEVTGEPTVTPSQQPSGEPTEQPTDVPSVEPTPTPDGAITPDPNETQIDEQDGDISNLDNKVTPTIAPTPVPTATPVPTESVSGKENDNTPVDKPNRVNPVIWLIAVLVAAAVATVVVIYVKKKNEAEL